MPTFVALRKPLPLPTIGQAIERPVMDWKVKPARWGFEKAKDVAAFANHLGGTLLVGAHEVDGELRAYVGMTATEAEAVRDGYSKEVVARCQPRPTIDFEQYDDPNDPTKRIVAINVQPSLNLVGVKVAGDKANEGYGGATYVFPVRSGTDATYLEPGQLSMFMTPQIRRVAVLLARIPKGRRVTVHHGHNLPKPTPDMIEVCEEENVVRMKSETKEFAIPLDRILSVYEDIDGWNIVVEYYR